MLKLFSFVWHKNKLKKHERVCNDHGYFYVQMSNENNKMLKYNNGEKSVRAPFTIHADLECLLEKMHSCETKPEKSYTEKKQKQKLSMHLLVTHCSQIVHLTPQKANLFVTKMKIV